MKKIILASKSPRRHEILNIAGLEHEIIVSDADETVPDGTAPAEAVGLISERKAKAVLKYITEENPGAEEYTDGFVIIAADTVVDVDGIIFGKPKDIEDAERMIRALSGRKHYVHTGITLTDGKKSVSETVTTAVCMRDISEREIKAYAACGEALDKAGAYAVQGKAGAFVSSMEGDYFNVVGLPLCRTCERLADFGIKLFENE